MTVSPDQPAEQSAARDSAAFAAALATEADARRAFDAAWTRLSSQLAGPPDLVLWFVSHDHAPQFEWLAAELASRAAPACVIGTTGESIVGGRREVERAPALSLWAARLPGVEIVPMHLEYVRAGREALLQGFPERLAEPWPAEACLLLLGDPYTFPTDPFLQRFAETHAGTAVVGGMASGGGPGENRLFWQDRVCDRGAVAVRLSGRVRLRTVVSQGCRPIGRTFVVTRSEGPFLQELGGKPALERLREVFVELSEHDRELMQQGLHVGRVVNEYQDDFERGDFLVRNALGFDRETSALAIGDHVRAGRTVQFHVRDAQSADEDLRERLSRLEPATGPRGGLLFTCNGRGTRLFDQPDHDAAVVSDALGDLPLAGFFAQGEIGPVGGKNFTHGFTASLAVIEAV